MAETRALKILMLEDSPDDVGLIERILRKDNLVFVNECVDTSEAFVNAVTKFQPDVILSDHGLPAFNSMEALKICKMKAPAAAFILVTGTVSEDYAISCIAQGADDYILKANMTRLPAAIRAAVKKRQLEKLKRDQRHALRSQNRELRKVNSELDNFVYSVSHNLRGPLVSQMGLLDIARAEDKEHRFSEIHLMMEQSMLKMDDTLKQIIDYAKNARNELNIEPIDWSLLIEQAIEKSRGSDKFANVELIVAINSPIQFYSDAERLGVALSNLISNAIEYSDKEKKAHVHISVVAHNTNATITIADNGIGIKEPIQHRIFDMFFRGTEQSRGSGLGLYIVRELMGRLDGEIKISSTFGAGTTAVITVPFAGACELPESSDNQPE